jgi:DtxR family Mn-dependent transcriptional regulator
MTTAAVEDYLKAIYKLGRAEEPVTTNAIAAHMRVAPASVTKMLKRMSAQGLVTHTPYHGVRLTRAGQRAALEVIRHHRLLELYLTVKLGLPIEQAHEEAERLEHALSEALEELIAQALGHPTADPHGDPIPTRAGELREERHPRLSEAPPGRTFRVERVSDSDPRRLRRLASWALLPGAQLRVLRRSSAAVTVQAGEATHRVPVHAAEGVFVREVPE